MTLHKVVFILLFFIPDWVLFYFKRICLLFFQTILPVCEINNCGTDLFTFFLIVPNFELLAGTLTIHLVHK